MLRWAKLVWISIAIYSIIVPLWGLYAVGRYVTPHKAQWIQLAGITGSTSIFITIVGYFMNVRRAELFGASIA